MDIVYIVQRRPKVRSIVQAKRSGQPADPVSLPSHCFKAVDSRTGDYLGEFDIEADAQALCDRLNAQLPQNQF